MFTRSATLPTQLMQNPINIEFPFELFFECNILRLDLYWFFHFEKIMHQKSVINSIYIWNQHHISFYFCQ